MVQASLKELQAQLVELQAKLKQVLRQPKASDHHLIKAGFRSRVVWGSVT